MINYVETKSIFKKQYIDGELYSCQIIVTILAIENLMGVNSNGISIYQKWIRSRGKRDIREATFSLVSLFLQIANNGYDNNYPLELNEDTNAMFGGAHRLGICLYLNIKNTPCVLKKSEKNIPKKYNIEYFKKILTESEILTLENKIKEYE